MLWCALSLVLLHPSSCLIAHVYVQELWRHLEASGTTFH